MLKPPKTRKRGKRKSQKDAFIAEFSLFLFPLLAIVPAVIGMWIFDYRLDIISAELEKGRDVNFIAVLFVELAYYLSFSTILGLITYTFKVSVFTVKNYTVFSMTTLIFILIWSFFKGDLDWVFSWQGIPLSYYIMGYVVVLPLYGFVIYFVCSIFQKKMDRVSSYPIKSPIYWRFANYLPNYFLSVTISYYLLKIGYSLGNASRVSRFFVFYYDGFFYCLLMFIFAVVVLTVSIVGDKIYQKIELEKIIKRVISLTLILCLISGMME